LLLMPFSRRVVPDNDFWSRRRLLRALGAATAVAGASISAYASEPIRIVIAFPPGGTSTNLVKPLEAPLQTVLGSAIERDYKPGAGGNVAALHVVQSKPDGHTLLVGHAGPLAINHHILVQSAFDPLKDLAPLAMLVEFPIVICVASRHGVNTLAQLVALAKQKRLVVGSSGNGSIQHLASEIFSREADIETVHIPFAGGGPLQQAFERGAIDLMLETGSNVIKHVREGAAKALAIMGRERLAVLPDTPTLLETGAHSVDVAAWFGLLAPMATPPEERARLSRAIMDVVMSDAVGEAYRAIGGIPRPLPPAEFARHIAAENERWGKLIQEAGLSRRGSSGTIGTPQ
jgi:tripartite-type tricarboxylate transporter receptor subunit TctC